MPPLDRRAAEAAVTCIPMPVVGGFLLASGATTSAVVVLGVAAVVAVVGGVRVWRTRPEVLVDTSGEDGRGGHEAQTG